MHTLFFFAKASRQNARNGVEHRADEVHGRLEAYPGALCRVGRGQRSIKVGVRRPCAGWQMCACFLIMVFRTWLAMHCASHCIDACAGARPQVLSIQCWNLNTSRYSVPVPLAELCRKAPHMSCSPSDAVNNPLAGSK